MNLKMLVWTVVLCCMLSITEAACPSSAVKLYAKQGPNFITSPNYPNDYGIYGTRLSCSWLILATPGYDDVIIQMKVINSSMEPSTGCWRDSVEIKDGSRSFSPELESWCGNTWPSGTIESTGTAVLVEFSTNFKDNDYYGFMLAYWMAKKPLKVVRKAEWTALNYVLMGISVTLFSGALGYLSLLLLLHVLRRGSMTEDELYEKKFS